MASVLPVTVTAKIADVSTAETIYFPVTANMVGRVTQVKTIIGGAIGTTDTNVVVSKNATVLGSIVIQGSGSAAGDIDTLDVTSNDGYLVVGDYLKVAVGGESTVAVGGLLAIDISR